MKPICPTAQIFSRERFRSKLEGRYEIVESGCWEWTAKIDRYGYGAVSVPLNGKWRTRKYDGYTVWICRVCERERIQRWHQKQRRAS